MEFQMLRNKKLWVIRKYFLSISMCLFLASSLQACDCEELSLEEYWKKSNIVFSGIAIKVNSSSEIYWNGKKLSYTLFKITSCFKGENFIADTITIFNYNTDCDYNFQEGKTYLVYGKLYVGSNFIRTDKCTGTKILEQSEEDLEYFKLLQEKSNKNEKENIPPPPMPILIETNIVKKEVRG